MGRIACTQPLSPVRSVFVSSSMKIGITGATGLIGSAFGRLAAEKGHERRFLALKKNLDEGIVFKRGGKVFWRCRNCGYLHEGDEAPAECPACKHEQAYFEVFGEVY